MAALARSMSRGRRRHAALLLCCVGLALCSDAPPAPEPKGPKPELGISAEQAPPRRALLAGLRRVVEPPLKAFREAPPITRSVVSASVLLSLLTSTRVVDMRSICFSEMEVLHRGEWWRFVTTFLFMGDQMFSIFYWMQIYHFWECLKARYTADLHCIPDESASAWHHEALFAVVQYITQMLELVKYHWEPSGFIKMIVSCAMLLIGLKQLRREAIFLSAPLVTTFMYMYSREYQAQPINFMGFFQIRCGWLPWMQMLQDLLQTGDAVPSMLGLIAGHIYYYCEEVAPRLLMPHKLPSLAEFLQTGSAHVAKPASEEEKESSETDSHTDGEESSEDSGDDQVEAEEEEQSTSPAPQ